MKITKKKLNRVIKEELNKEALLELYFSMEPGATEQAIELGIMLDIDVVGIAIKTIRNIWNYPDYYDWEFGFTVGSKEFEETTTYLFTVGPAGGKEIQETITYFNEDYEDLGIREVLQNLDLLQTKLSEYTTLPKAVIEEKRFLKHLSELFIKSIDLK